MPDNRLKTTKNRKLSPVQGPRVRIAPSPTGPLHIGTARTALFNYLFARKRGGSFILRIEDTDIERSDPKWEKDIVNSLKWLGIKWDEGPLLTFPKKKSGRRTKYTGSYGPYRQSERLNSYAKYLEKLLKAGQAYYCFCSEQDLEAERQYFMSMGMPPHYSGKCRNLNQKEVKKKLAAGKKAIIRFKMPQQKVEFKDLIRGKLEFDTGLIGDIAIAKDLASPLYNFAVVVDDFEMKITHVIRGEDHISNTPKQILIQEALGFPKVEYAHLPLILGPDRSKLSKRHGAVSIGQYKREGYLPEAMANFMAFLGWNPGTQKEIFSLESLVKEFSLDKIQKGGAVFNIQKLDYLNGFYIRRLSLSQLARLGLPFLAKAGFLKRVREGSETERLLEEIFGLYQTRLKKLSEITGLVDFFFKDKLEYNKELLKWKSANDKDVSAALRKLYRILSEVKPGDFNNKERLEKILIAEAKRAGDTGKLLWPMRVALTGKEASAGPFEIAAILGKKKTLARIKEAQTKAF